MPVVYQSMRKDVANLIHLSSILPLTTLPIGGDGCSRQMSIGADNDREVGLLMSSSPIPVRADTLQQSGLRYSICTIVTRPQEYAEMVASFEAKGFGPPDCEFLYLDNSKSNEYDAYAGYNLFLTVARGDHVILCHQDVLLDFDDRSRLDSVIADLDRRDPRWAACGNSGGISPGRWAIRLTDPHEADRRWGELPARVLSLDENFIVVKRQANLVLSHDLGGFHLYGADICLVADLLGRTAYVVDFHLRHKSPGVRDASLAAARFAFIAKYRRVFRSRWMVTPCETFFLSGVPLLARLLSLRYVVRAFTTMNRTKSKLANLAISRRSR